MLRLALTRTAHLAALRSYSTAAAAPQAFLQRLSAAKVPGLEAQEPDEGVSLLTLNRAAARNAISRQMIGELEECIEKVRVDGTRVLIVRSLVEGTFCAGADLRERKTMSMPEVDAFLLALRRTFSALERLPIPSLAALDGTALGGGLELALASDIRVAGPNAKLGLTETKLGIIPGAGGTHRLTRIVGPARAKDLIFSARLLDAAAAREVGVVEHVATTGQSGQEAFGMAVELARAMAVNGPLALRAAKMAIDRGNGMDTESALDWERACYDRLMGTKDRLEGLKAFAEKRKPRYIGE